MEETVWLLHAAQPSGLGIGLISIRDSYLWWSFVVIDVSLTVIIKVGIRDKLCKSKA